jgi:hypothetical protein
VTALGVNGKITFLEKFGTGAPNTTGAYELDPSIVDAGGNWSSAWRPMHVNTDIFCSASLTLPDKAGRQINIGGWALGATFGIREYRLQDFILINSTTNSKKAFIGLMGLLDRHLSTIGKKTTLRSSFRMAGGIQRP